ncbi:formin-like protein 4 [Euphorbia lathyris]|uniref:formin-like protein 4 n=1 Tax=Euphorbia lathyris TaxID=212925 RepID=UPI003313C005
MSVPASSSSSLSWNLIIAVVATAAITLIITTTIFLCCHRCAIRRHRKKIGSNSQAEALVSEEFREFVHKVKGLIVNEPGQEFVYVKDLQGKASNEQPPMIVTPLPSKVPAVPETTKSPPPPPPPPTPPPIPPLPMLPPLMAKKKTLPPPPPPMAGGLVSSSRPPRSTFSSKSRAQGSTAEASKDTSFGQMKLKPLHWDKVIANADHSMVWNEIIDGSLRFDDDQIELLFGYKHADRRSSQGNAILSSTSPSRTAQIFILEPRKSQNTAIVLKSIAISRDEILDALLEGHGLTTDTLEKLTRIAPTQEEKSKILQFSGDPSTLANAEGFLYHILKALPSAFVRTNAMLFRSNYDAEILHFKEALQTLELGCKELRTQGLFLKLLEAILKAGNRMNAGTSRGNAQGFNLTTLRKLSDVKSIDGKTTLLHFVVEQVARSEGRHSLLKQKRNFEKKDSQEGSNIYSEILTDTDKDEEYLVIGLQALRGLSSDMFNVKKAADIEYDCFMNTYSSLATHVEEIQLLITNNNNGEGGTFVREMKGFLEECKEELKVVEEEQTRILEFVKRTTKYYQAGATKHERSCLQLFIIVKDFLDMVDKVCTNISKSIKTKNVAASPKSRSLQVQPIKSPVRFPDRLHLTSDAPSSSESDNDF